MNYRHAFHAGNHADVLKHAILALVLEHMKKKDAPFRVLDVFAGIGLYDLGADEAARSPEWQDGIARVMVARNRPVSLMPLINIINNLNSGTHLSLYPGSPEIARQIVRPQDRLMLAELHPVDAETLAGRYADQRSTKVERRDGWEAIRAWLPPEERRGVILIDPPFEIAGEYDRLLRALDQGLQRFATGTFLLWHAAKDPLAVAEYEAALSALPAKILRASLCVRNDGITRGLSASGMVIVNPPWTLEQDLAELLPWLAESLAQGGGASWQLDRLAGQF